MNHQDASSRLPAGRTTSARLSRRQALRNGLGVLSCGALGGMATSPSRAAEAKPAAGKFVYCLNTGTIRGQKLGIVKEAETAAAAGYQAIEPWTSDLDQYQKGGGSLRELRQRIKDLGLTVACAIGFSGWVAEDEKARAEGLERAKRDMELVAQVGGTRIAAPPAGATREPGLSPAAVVDRYGALLELGISAGVVPLLELWGFSATLHRVGEIAYVLTECGHPKAAAVLDTFHIYKGGSDFGGLRFFTAKSLPVYHINDYPADPPRAEVNDGHRVFPGDGVAPTTEILQHLAADGGRRVLSLELFNRDYWQRDALAVAREGLQKMKQAVTRAAV
jgi:sugar phosphate isomerase/epimerase